VAEFGKDIEMRVGRETMEAAEDEERREGRTWAGVRESSRVRKVLPRLPRVGIAPASTSPILPMTDLKQMGSIPCRRDHGIREQQ